jgi:dihydrofolate reductase
MITMIAAAAENNALGKNNDLVWHLPDDFKRFKRLTSGHYIIMGRKTFESFPKLLPDRTHVIITRKKDYKPENTIVVNSLEEAVRVSKLDEQPFIIGGGEIYKMGMDFPEIDEENWELVKEQFHEKDERHDHSFTYLTYERRK